MPPKRKLSKTKDSAPKSKRQKVDEPKLSKSSEKSVKIKKGTPSGPTSDDTSIKNESKQKALKQVKGKKHISDAAFSLESLVTDKDWKDALKDEFDKSYFKEIQKKLEEHYEKKDEIFPPKDLIFNALNSTPLSKVKVVILGQDPYHDDGQAMGLSFSVPNGIGVPPSLKNIYKELESDSDVKPKFKIPTHGCLEKWVQEGVLLLNATLTVTAHQPNSHAKYGWQKFTDAVILTISQKCDGVVFILWGGFAQKKEKLIDQSKHGIVKTAHPSPLSFGKFFHCKCFSKTNEELKKFGKSPVDWTL